VGAQGVKADERPGNCQRGRETYIHVAKKGGQTQVTNTEGLNPEEIKTTFGVYKRPVRPT